MFIYCICCLLLFAGCREPVPPLVNTTATEPSITPVEPTAGTTETITAATEPEETQATEAATTTTGPQTTETTTASADCHTTEPTQEVSSAQGVELTESSAVEGEPTKPLGTETPSEDAVVSADSKEETAINLDCELAVSVGNQYGSDTYGWTVDLSLNETNAGFNFGSWVFADEGQDRLNSAGKGQIDFLYNELRSRYPDQDLSSIRFCVHAFLYGDNLYEVRVYYA